MDKATLQWIFYKSASASDKSGASPKWRFIWCPKKNILILFDASIIPGVPRFFFDVLNGSTQNIEGSLELNLFSLKTDENLSVLTTTFIELEKT